MSPGPQKKVAGLSVVAVAAIVVGCSAGTPSGSPESGVDADPPQPSGSLTPTDSPSSVQPSAPPAEQLAIDAYLGMWEDYAAAAETADWQSPLLDDHATGEALSVMSRGLYASQYNGEVAKGRPVLNPEVSSASPPADPTSVMISDCGDSSNWLKYDEETGELVDDEPEGRRSITATVEKQPDGTWKVTGFAVRGVGSC